MTAAVEIERNLLGCFERCAPRDRVVVEKAAILAARLANLDATIRDEGCSDTDATLHRSLLTALGSALFRLGPGRICSSTAANIMARGYATAAATFAVLPPAGSA